MRTAPFAYAAVERAVCAAAGEEAGLDIRWLPPTDAPLLATQFRSLLATHCRHCAACAASIRSPPLLPCFPPPSGLLHLRSHLLCDSAHLFRTLRS